MTRWAKLEDRELVLSRLGSAVAGEPEYIFKHVLTRDVAYESLPSRERAPATRRWPSGSRRRPASVAASSSELLAYHYASASPSRRAPGRCRSSPEGVRAPRMAGLQRAPMQASGGRPPPDRCGQGRRARDRALDDRERSDRTLVALGDAIPQRLRRRPRVYVLPRGRRAPSAACTDGSDGRRSPSSAPARGGPDAMARLDDARPSERGGRNRYLELGFANVPEGDSEEHVRLLIAAGFGPSPSGPGGHRGRRSSSGSGMGCGRRRWRFESACTTSHRRASTAAAGNACSRGL